VAVLDLSPTDDDFGGYVVDVTQRASSIMRLSAAAKAFGPIWCGQCGRGGLEGFKKFLGSPLSNGGR